MENIYNPRIQRVRPFSSSRHAWLLVETGEGAQMPVESTNIQIV